MQLLIIGGTRFIGPGVVRSLAALGNGVTVFHRGRSTARLPEGTTEILGDRHDQQQLTAAIEQARPEVIVDMVCLTEADAHSLAQAASGRLRRVVLVSSIDVYAAFGRLIGREDGAVDNSVITEQSPLRCNLYPYREEQPRAADDPRRILDDYDKILAERALQSHQGIDSVVLRLPMVYGPHDYQRRLTPYLRPMLDGRPALVLDSVTACWKTSRGYVDNVGHAIALAAVTPAAAGRTYNVAEPQALEEQHWVQRIGAAQGWHGHVVIAPVDELPEALRPESPPQQQIFASSELIRRELGFSEVMDPEHALMHSLAWEAETMPEAPPEQAAAYAAEDEYLARVTV